MKSENEQHGHEIKSPVRPQDVKPVPQTPTFSENSVNSTATRDSAGAKKPNRQWDDVPTSDQERPELNVTTSTLPMKPKSHRHISTARAANGKRYDQPHNRIPDTGKYWEATPYDKQQPPIPLTPDTPANQRPANILRWEKRGYDLGQDTYQDFGPANRGEGVVGQTPQRKKFRKQESKN